MTTTNVPQSQLVQTQAIGACTLLYADNSVVKIETFDEKKRLCNVCLMLNKLEQLRIWSNLWKTGCNIKKTNVLFVSELDLL